MLIVKFGETMKKLRSKFWTESKSFIEWCDDEELRVLGGMVKTEMEKRITEFTQKFDKSEESKKQRGRQKAKKTARGL